VVELNGSKVQSRLGGRSFTPFEQGGIFCRKSMLRSSLDGIRAEEVFIARCKPPTTAGIQVVLPSLSFFNK
jgi:hypothetical protein